MPIRKWDKLQIVTHNDMYIISVGIRLTMLISFTNDLPTTSL